MRPCPRLRLRRSWATTRASSPLPGLFLWRRGLIGGGGGVGGLVLLIFFVKWLCSVMFYVFSVIIFVLLLLYRCCCCTRYGTFSVCCCFHLVTSSFFFVAVFLVLFCRRFVYLVSFSFSSVLLVRGVPWRGTTPQQHVQPARAGRRVHGGQQIPPQVSMVLT